MSFLAKTDFCDERQEERLRRSFSEWIRCTTRPPEEWDCCVSQRHDHVKLTFSNWNMYGDETKRYGFTIRKHPDKPEFLIVCEKTKLGTGCFDSFYGRVCPNAHKTLLCQWEIPFFGFKRVRDCIRKMLCKYERESFRAKRERK